MTVLWLIIGAGAGGGLGWLIGRFNARRRRECTTPMWGMTANPRSGAVAGVIMGLLLAYLITAAS